MGISKWLLSTSEVFAILRETEFIALQNCIYRTTGYMPYAIVVPAVVMTSGLSGYITAKI